MKGVREFLGVLLKLMYRKNKRPFLLKERVSDSLFTV